MKVYKKKVAENLPPLCFSSATLKKSSFKALLQFVFSYQQLAQLQRKFARSLVICISFKLLFCSWIFTKYLTSLPLCCFTFMQLLMHFCDQTLYKNYKLSQSKSWSGCGYYLAYIKKYI